MFEKNKFVKKLFFPHFLQKKMTMTSSKVLTNNKKLSSVLYGRGCHQLQRFVPIIENIEKAV